MNPTAEELVLYADEDVLAINKPAGLPTLPDGYDREAAHVRSVLWPLYGRLWIVHRLDRETSGVLALARSAEAHRDLNMQFESHQALKVYHALVVGEPTWESTMVDLPLLPDGDRRHRTLVDDEHGKPARTEMHVLERFEGYSLVQAVPRSGRTHQIRAHLSALGYSLVGDRLYGVSEGLFLSELKPGFCGGIAGECALIRRVGLHARSLELTHPSRGDALRFEAPYPKDFAAALRQLRRYSLPPA